MPYQTSLIRKRNRYWQVTLVTLHFGMITSFKHRGLKALYDGKSSRRVTPEHVRKLLDILAVLDQSSRPENMDLPGFRLHQLKGTLKGHYAITVASNWRVTFRFDGENVVDVDYVDYH